MESLFALAGGALQDHFASRLAELDDAHRLPTLTPILEHALRHMDPRTVLAYAANPAALGRAPEAHIQALHPPVILMSSDRTGKVSTKLTGLAAENRDFGASLIHLTALCGAVERLLFPTADRYQFCPHGGCEHRQAGLCFRYFTPPSVERGHEQCQFPPSFESITGASPRAAWAGLGLERKSVDEIVAELEATGEAGLLALVRRHKAAIVAWLGREGFDDLEWKCEATAEKAMRAMQTNKIDHLVEARAFRDAVVREVARRAAESREPGRG